MSALHDRFIAKVSPEAITGCWLWDGTYFSNGYGALKVQGKMLKAHRVAFELFNRPIAMGELICHHCDTPACVNPKHLFAGSSLDNNRDMMRKGRADFSRCGNAQKTHCKNGHPLVGDHIYRWSKRNERTCRICRAAYMRVYTARSKSIFPTK